MTSLDAPIAAVTVYPGSARVVRHGTLALPRGRHRLEITRLPSSLERDSVRISGTGPAEIVSVEVGFTRYAGHDDNAEVGHLHAELRLLDRRLSEITDTRTVLAAQQESLTTLSNRAGRSVAAAVVRDGAEPEQLDGVVSYVTSRLDDVLARLRELSDSERETHDERARVERALADLASADQDSTTITVELQVSGRDAVRPSDDTDAAVGVEVSYLVPGASWTSRYDAHLNDGRLELTWFALVTQSSGETWPPGELRLSTAQPAIAVSVPELATWYLRERPAMQPMASGAAVPRAAPMALSMEAAAPAGMKRAAAVAEPGLIATEYVVQQLRPVPPDGGDHQVLVGAFELDAHVDRVTAPVLNTDVVIRVEATNSTEHTMRPGRAALFHGPQFVGTTDLASWAPGEKRELALGLDDRIRVERKLVHRHAGRAVVGGTRRHELGYRTEVTNHGPVATSVSVLDQVPVSASPEITVKDVKIVPAPVSAPTAGADSDLSDGELGLVRWNCQLDPGETAVCSLSFRVDAAKGVDLVGWRD